MRRFDYLWLKWRAIVALLFNRRSQARALYDTMLRLWPDDAYALSSRTHLRSQMGDLTGALDDSSRLVALAQVQGRDWFNHGFLLEQAERWDEALEAFRRATALDPKLDRAWYGLGLVLIRLQRYDEAVEALKRNTELQPMSPYGWYQLARVHVDRRQPEEAVKIIRHLKGFEPKVAAQLERETGLLAAPTASS